MMSPTIHMQEIKALLSAKKSIVLTSHTNPDGDAIGSLLGMYHFLTSKGHSVSMIIPNKFPDFYNWMPDSSSIINYEKKAKSAQKLIAMADVIFSLDYNALQRIGPVAEFVMASRGVKILIDHHIDPEKEQFDFCISDVNYSSTGELIYKFISDLGDLHLLNKKAADSLYTCIVTDTGSFSFSCNRPETYEITAHLVRLGVDAAKIHKLIYDTFSENRLRLLGFAISTRMLVWDEFKTALIYLTKSDLNKFKYAVGDTEGLVNYPLMMNKINLSILITEKDNKLRLSMRSKGDFSVNDLARKHFNGGGHKNAAGGNVTGTIDDLITDFRGILPYYKNDLDFQLEY